MSTTRRPRRLPNCTAPASSANNVSSPPRPTFSPGWKWEAAGDTNGDGRADLVQRYTQTGLSFLYITGSDANPTSRYPYYTLSPPWFYAGPR